METNLEELIQITGNFNDSDNRQFFIKNNEEVLLGPFKSTFELFDHLRYECLRSEKINFKILATK